MRARRHSPLPLPIRLALAFGLVLAASARPVSAQDAQAGQDAEEDEGGSEETIRYTIQLGDTCYGIAQRFFGNPRQCHEVIYRYNPQMGSDASNIRPGVTITIPVRSQNAPDARVTRTARQVQARSGTSTEWRAARRGLGLYRGWHVSTEESASAEVTFRDESQIQMRENTLVIIYGGTSTSTARRRTSQATLERGTLRSRLGELRLQVDTPSGGADLDGGSSVVAVDSEGSSVVSNHSGGAARVRGTTGPAVTVRPGFGSSVARGERPARPRPLPAAPALTSSTRREFVGVVGAGGTLVGEWTEVPGAAHYRVELSTEPDGSGLVAAVQTPASVHRFEVHRLPAGTYYLALATLDATRLESAPSERIPLRVALVGLQPPGAAEPERTRVDEGDWGRPAQTPEVLRGTRFVSPDDFRCGLADGAAGASGVFARAGRAELTCTGPAGETLPALGVVVEQPAVAVEGVPPGETPRVVRGEARELGFTLAAGQPLPSALRVSAPPGVEIREVRQEAGRVVVTLVASPSAPATFELAVFADTDAAGDPPAGLPGSDPSASAPASDSARLAEVAVSVTEPAPTAAATPAPVPEAPAAAPRALAPHEAFGLALHPSLLGLTDDRRVGSGGFTALSHQGRLAAGEGYWRASVGVEAAPLPGLRVGVAHAVDVAEEGLVPAQRGDRDLSAWVGYRAIVRDAVSLYAELAAWFPTGGAREGIASARLAPSLSLSVRAGERFLLRTRQGALLATDDGGPFLWASAYGADVRLLDALYVGLELDSSLGRAEGDLFAGLGVGLGLSARVGPATFSLGVRYALTDDLEVSVGRFTLSVGVRVALE